MSQLVPLLEFSTDVSDFAPPNESEDRIQVIESEFPPQMSRIYVDVKSSDETENPLSIDALNTLYQKSDFVDELAQEHEVDDRISHKCSKNAEYSHNGTIPFYRSLQHG